jgi:uncharacterized repeat protein (TIGR01451 family)
MPLRLLTRLLAAAVLAAGAAPAFAQVNLATKLSLSSTGVPLGKATSYLLDVTNNGTEVLSEFQVDPTFDAAFTTPTGAMPTIVSGCTPNDPTGVVLFPCTWRGLLYGTQVAEIEISVTYPKPAGFDPATATCPTTTPVSFSTSMAISKFNGSSTITNSGTSSDSNTSSLRPYADLEVVSVTNDAGGGGVNQNATYTYTTVVKNNGPCDAPAVRVQWAPSSSFTYVDASVSANCATNTSMNDLNRCQLTTLAKGAEMTVTSQWAIGTYPSDLRSGNAIMDVTATPRGTPATDDPVAGNNTNEASNAVNGLNTSSCSTGGAAGILSGLLALAALRRRRA